MNARLFEKARLAFFIVNPRKFVSKLTLKSVFQTARQSDSVQKDIQSTLVIKQTNESRLKDFLISVSKNQNSETASFKTEERLLDAHKW